MLVETEEKVEETSEFQPSSLDELFGEPSAEPSKEEVKVQKEEETNSDEAPAVVETETKETEDEKEETAIETEKPTIDWEAEDNPYKERYKNTQAWGNKAHQKLKEFGIEEEDSPEPDVERQTFAFQEREKASMAAAVEVHGKDNASKIYKAVCLEAADNPQLFQRIFNSTTPVLEAIRYSKESAFFGKYGYDIEKIPVKIRSELEPELREKITKELQRKLTKKEEMPNTLSGVKSKDTKVEEQPFTPTPLNQLFG